jgi:hypothetical protein
MRSTFRWFVGVVSCSFVLSACSRNDPANTVTAEDKRAFDSASPEVKQLWTGALESAKTNGYVDCQNQLNLLLQADITPEQKAAALREGRTMSDKLMAAADKGDPAAKEALQQLQTHPRARGR